MILLSAYSLQKSPGQARRYLTLQIRAENFLYVTFLFVLFGRIVDALYIICIHTNIVEKSSQFNLGVGYKAKEDDVT